MLENQGLFLTTDVQFLWVKNSEKPWMDNYSKLFLYSKNGSPEQMWFICEKDTIKHLKDGRVLSAASNAPGKEIDVNIGFEQEINQRWYFEKMEGFYSEELKSLNICKCE